MGIEQKSRLRFTFDNNEVYEIYMYDDNGTVLNPDDRFINSLSGNNSEASLDGNPIGVVTSDEISVSIYDPNNYLMPNNSNSPYYGYLRSGVKLEHFISDNGQWIKNGVYYTTAWETGYLEGTHDVANITASDKLQYILSQEIPKLPIYSGIKIIDLVKIVFNAIGITDSEYYIDNSLNTTMLYGLNEDDTVGNFLNNVAQALLARVSIDGDGIIKIIPVSTTSDNTYTIKSDEIINIHSEINYNSCMYSKARLNYVKTGNETNGSIAGNTGVTLEVGLNEFNGLKLSGAKANEICNVTFELPSNVDDDVITGFEFNAYQSGIDIKITNGSSSPIENVSFSVGGRYLTGIDKTEESTIGGSDTKIGNTLDIENTLIQDATQAKELVNKYSEYLRQTQYVVVLETVANMLIRSEDRVIINAGIEKFDGTYKVMESDTDYAPKSYTKTLKLMKLEV